MRNTTFSKFYLLFGVLISVVLSSCSDYQKLLKSKDYELKYERALAYYEKGDYTRASTLFGELIGIYKGTEKAEVSHYTYAECLYGMRDYYMASHYYQMFIQNYPASDKLEDAYFKNGYCSYLTSANPRLDQSETLTAIDQFQLYMNLFPNSEKASQVSALINELNDKLVYKAYLSAKLYYDLGTYMGNNYLSAVIAASNVLEEYPDTKYREELSFLILDSKYIQAIKSVEEKKEERLRDALDEYYSFVNEFPTSQYLKSANKIYQTASNLLKKE